MEHFEKEQSIHNNTECSGLYIVKNGRLRITFDVYLDAEIPSDCYRISGQAFGLVSERVPAVKIYALETAVSRFSDVNKK